MPLLGLESKPVGFLESMEKLGEELAEEARRAGTQYEGGLLWAHAGELYEFGTGDHEAATRCYERAVLHPEAPPQAFAGLRRLARSSDDPEQVGALYRQEFQASKHPLQTLRAAVQRAIWQIRSGELDEPQSMAIAEEIADRGDVWAELLASMVREDLALSTGFFFDAAKLKTARFELAKSVLTDTPPDRRELALIAASVGLTHRYLTGEHGEALHWFGTSFELAPSESSLRHLHELGLPERNLLDYESRLSTLAETTSDTAAKARALYELGHLRAHRIGDRTGARNALREGLRQPDSGIACAAPFLGLSRSAKTVEEPEAIVDALGLQAENAATPRERADCLYQMALIFDRDLQLPDAAIELLRDTLTVLPDHRSAARALSRLYQRRGSWAVLAELLEEEVARQPDVWRTRMKLAEVYQDRLAAPDKALPHLRRVLERRLYTPAVRRLNVLLAEQERWMDLYDHLVSCAERETTTRERLYDLEQAADIAESRLERADLAIDCWRVVHEIDRAHPGGLTALGRLYAQTGRWDDLVALNKDEIEIRGEPTVAAYLWTRNGEISERHLNDEETAQHCYERALEILPTHEPALEGLGRILWRHQDWDRLIEMYEAEVAACDGKRRRRCLFELGELQATLARRPEGALATFGLILADEPDCEEALLWTERLHQELNDEERLFAVLEKRRELVDEEQRPAISLRLASIAEWSLSDPERAYDEYLEALTDRRSRPHAVAGLARLLVTPAFDRARVDRGIERLCNLMSDEADANVRAVMVAMAARLARGRATLDEWLAVHSENSHDFVAEAAADLQSSISGKLEELAEIRGQQRSGSLWSLIARVDSETKTWKPAAPVPESEVAAAVLSEIDTPQASAPFRTLVRGWESGNLVPDGFGNGSSIPCLRLLAHHAMASGDVQAASRYSELEAEEWSQASARQRRLTLAAELRHGGEPEIARELFRRALVCGCFNDRSRGQLYETLERCGENELLIEGLAAHATQAEDDRERAGWLQRLAGIHERVGDRAASLESWEAVLKSQPTDRVAWLELARLLTLEGRPTLARTRLEKALDNEFVSADRVLILGKLADLHLMEGGEGTRAVEVLEEVVLVSERDADWVRKLARAHYSFGDPERAMTLLTEALPSEPTVADLADWFLLARLKYLRLHDVDSARELLWGLIEKFPSNSDALRELEAYYRQCSEAAEFAERLSTMLVDPPEDLDDGTRALLWEYVGDLNYTVLKRNRDAEVAFEAAASAGADCPRLDLKVARALGQQPAKGREAWSRFVMALRSPGVGVEEWIEAVGDLKNLFELVEDQARVRIMTQIGALLAGQATAESESVRVKRDPARRLKTRRVADLLTHGLLGSGSVETMEAMAPILEKSFGQRRARKRTLGGRRLKPAEAPDFSRLVQLAADTSGVGAPRVYVGTGSQQPEVMSNGGFWMPLELFEVTDELTERFWAGHIVAMTGFDASAASLAYEGEIGALLTEIIRVASGGVQAKDSEYRHLRSSRLRGSSERVSELVGQYPDLIERSAMERWHAMPALIADRFGLLMSGDVLSSVNAILALDADLKTADRAERIIGETRPRALLEYALSYAYQELRYLCGLSAKPKLL
jgi:tetratricopeptide (TPR) repeat protein